MKCVSVCALFLLLAGAVAVPAKSGNSSGYKPPRTPDGKPDLQGTWTNVSLTTLLRSAEFKTNTVSAEEAERLARRLADATEKSLAPIDPNEAAPLKGANVSVN